MRCLLVGLLLACPRCPLLPAPVSTAATPQSAAPPTGGAGLGLPDSARQRAQAAALEAALEHSAAEVRDLLAALDATSALAASAAAAGADADSSSGAAGDGGREAAAAAAVAAEGAIDAVRSELAAAHERVQAAAARMQAAAGKAEQLKGKHSGLHAQVGWL